MADRTKARDLEHTWRRARARAAGLVRGVRDRNLGAAAPPIPAGLWADRTRDLVPDESLWTVTERYRGRFDQPPLSYGTVRDYTDSAEALPRLATLGQSTAGTIDMKNLQRCWALKAILGGVEPGSRVVEIGAGEPLVAGTLARMGYDVTVVDPYDGSGNGPIEYRSFVRAYPGVGFVRETFPPTEPIAGPVGCVYSISVLEHVPVEAVGGVVEAARGLVAEGGLCVHAVDHVLRGWSADQHRELTGEVAAASGISAEHLDEILGRMDFDPETYLVSAEAHNMWRGMLPYDEYPMRRIGSLQIVDRVGS